MLNEQQNVRKRQKENAYSPAFIKKELASVKDSVVFVALADLEYVQGLLSEGHYINRQGKLAIKLHKPVLIAFEKRVSNILRHRVISFFPTVEKVLTYDGTNILSRKTIISAAEDILHRLYPEENNPIGSAIDAFDDPGAGLHRIGHKR
jgi:hypothetical protein